MTALMPQAELVLVYMLDKTSELNCCLLILMRFTIYYND